jgi:hypothetical protein
MRQHDPLPIKRPIDKLDRTLNPGGLLHHGAPQPLSIDNDGLSPLGFLNNQFIAFAW